MEQIDQATIDFQESIRSAQGKDRARRNAPKDALRVS